jgi:DNA-binding protein WhiA
VSLSDDVRSELAAIEPRKACCRLAELSALVRTAGSVHLRGGGRISLHLEVASPAVARRTFALLRAYGVPAEVRTHRQQAFERARRFQIHVGDDARAVQALNESGVLDERLAPLEAPPARVTARSCCRAAYLRGVLLASGSVSGPRHAHLELRASSVEVARFVARLAAAEGFELAVGERRGHGLGYAKAAADIADFLAFVGAHEAALRFQERSVVASTKARANRLANADHANIARASRAADAQLSAIKRLQATGLLDRVSPELREMADLRRRHPTLSLRELARRSRPPTTKASAARRLAKLQKLAEQ